MTLKRVTGIDGYEAALEYDMWFRAYDRPRKGTPTHSVHIVRPSGQPGRGVLVDIWQGPLTKLIKDAVIGGYIVKVAEVPAEPLQLAFDFAEVA